MNVVQPAPDSNRLVVNQDVNLSTQHFYALTLTAPLELTKWWTLYANGVFYYNRFLGNLDGTALDRGQPAFNLTANNSLTLPHGWAADLNGHYESREVYGFRANQQRGQVAAGLQKSLWGKQGTLRLNVTDIFYTTPIRVTSTYANFTETFYQAGFAGGHGGLHLPLRQQQSGCCPQAHGWCRRGAAPRRRTVALVSQGIRHGEFAAAVHLLRHSHTWLLPSWAAMASHLPFFSMQISQMAAGLSGSEIIRIGNQVSEQVRQGAKICNLTIGDFDPGIFPIPANLNTGIQEAYQAGLTNYPPAAGMGDLRQAVSAFCKPARASPTAPTKY